MGQQVCIRSGGSRGDSCFLAFSVFQKLPVFLTRGIKLLQLLLVVTSPSLTLLLPFIRIFVITFDGLSRIISPFRGLEFNHICKVPLSWKGNTVGNCEGCYFAYTEDDIFLSLLCKL